MLFQIRLGELPEVEPQRVRQGPLPYSELLLESEKVGLLIWSPLAGGFLTGKFSRTEKGPEGARRASFNFPPVDETRGYVVLDALAEVAHEHQVSVARVALAWLLHQRVTTRTPHA